MKITKIRSLFVNLFWWGRMGRNLIDGSFIEVSAQMNSMCAVPLNNVTHVLIIWKHHQMNCVLLTFQMNNQNGIIFTIDSVDFNGSARCMFFYRSLSFCAFDIAFFLLAIGHFLGLFRCICHELRVHTIRLLKWNKTRINGQFFFVALAIFGNVKSKQWMHSISYHSIENDGELKWNQFNV